MGKDKLKKFRENLTFRNMIQPEFEDIFHKDHPLKGHWREEFFHNGAPIVLELGCGRGEYTVALAERCREKNFIGVDIKGARMWRGAKTATENGMDNVAFLRTRIEFINSFFGPGEVNEIWITFPDPQLKAARAKKRLTSPIFLEYYRRFLAPGAKIRLKTDSKHLHEYTKAVVAANALPVEACCDDIYGTGMADASLSIKTAYESMFLEQGLPITYIGFGLGDSTAPFVEPEFDEEPGLAEKAERSGRLVGA